MNVESIIRYITNTDHHLFIETGMLKSAAVRNAMLAVDRADFCPVGPYFDCPQGIGYNATISAPHMHAFALEESLKVKNVRRILDIGSGSGYLTACLAILHPEAIVVGVEHIPQLVEQSRCNIRKHNAELLERIHLVMGDGRKGGPEVAPYDFIHVGAATPEVPTALSEQLQVGGGLMIIPIGRVWQEICRVRKEEDGTLKIEKSLPVRYVPLTDKQDQYYG